MKIEQNVYRSRLLSLKESQRSTDISEIITERFQRKTQAEKQTAKYLREAKRHTEQLAKQGRQNLKVRIRSIKKRKKNVKRELAGNPRALKLERAAVAKASRGVA